MTISEREVERVFEALKLLNAKLDAVSATLADLSGKWLALTQKTDIHETRLNKFSERQRLSEQVQTRHRVVLSILAAAALVLGTAIANRYVTVPVPAAAAVGR